MRTVIPFAISILFCAEITYGQTFKLTDSTTYFPFEFYKREYKEEVIIDSGSLEFHSRQLHRFNEPKLFLASENKIIYRFTWLRSFDPPLIISVINDGLIKLEIKIGNRIGFNDSYVDMSKLTEDDWLRYYDFQDGTVDSLMVADIIKKIRVKKIKEFKYRSWSKKISEKKFKDFELLVQKNTFWKYPSTRKVIFGEGMDGADWILEGKIGERYHMVYRWSPDEGDDFKEICEYLIDIAGVAEKEDIY